MVVTIKLLCGLRETKRRSLYNVREFCLHAALEVALSNPSACELILPEVIPDMHALERPHMQLTITRTTSSCLLECMLLQLGDQGLEVEARVWSSWSTKLHFTLIRGRPSGSTDSAYQASAIFFFSENLSTVEVFSSFPMQTQSAPGLWKFVWTCHRLGKKKKKKQSWGRRLVDCKS